MNFEQLKEKASGLPLAPGVYIMRDKSDHVIYVGKAKKLKNRVSQYFQDTAAHSPKTRIMVSKICHFDVIVAASEFEALVLECFDDLARMWLNVGHKCPGIYLDAFLNLALPSLYPYSEYRVAQPYIEVGIQPGVVTAPFGQPPMMQPGRFEGIRNWIYEHIYSTGMDDVPVLRLLFNTGFIYWVLLMIVLYELYSGNGVRFMLLLLPVMLWGTYLLGPVMQGRYLYPFICVLPLFSLRPKKN